MLQYTTHLLVKDIKMTFFLKLLKKLYTTVDGTNGCGQFRGVPYHLLCLPPSYIGGLPYHLLSLAIIELNPTIDNPYINFVL